MTCDQVRTRLLEIDLTDVSELEPHLSQCPDCTAALARIRDAELVIGGAVDDFATEGDFMTAFAAATDVVVPEPHTRNWTAHGMLVGLAAAAVVLLAFRVGTTPPPPSPSPTPEPPVTEGPAQPALPAPVIRDEPAAARPEATLPQAKLDCQDLVRLEPAAMVGKLRRDQETCLELRFESESRDTERNKISRVLMVNAFSKGDADSWEVLVERHLSLWGDDPDLNYKFALHNSKKRGREEVVIRYAEQALEHRNVWTGSTYVSRVFNLYKLRAAAGRRLVETDATQRDRAGTYAYEWLEYARAAGKDTSHALQLCNAMKGDCD